MYLLDVTNLRIVRYRRKSTEGDDRQAASLSDQATALDDTAKKFQIPPSQLVADFSEARSAKVSHVRPEFQNMIEMIERGEANAILSWHPDRLSRNIGDVDALVRLLESGKLIAIITPQYIFGNTPLEKYILVSECTRAKLENDNKGVNVKRGLAGKILKGWRPGIAKIGYLNDTTKGRGYRDIVPDPDRFEKVKRLLKLFLTGDYSVREVHRIANQRLLLRTRPTKRQGNKPLSLSLVYYLLTDPFYCGKFWWKNPESGERQLYQGKHKPMITEEEFWQIQALLGKRPKPQPKSHLFAYTSLIVCGECGASITAEEKWQIICGKCKTKFASQNKSNCPKCEVPISEMEKRKLLHYVYYHCTKKRGACSQAGVRVESLESDIDEALARINISEKYVLWALDSLKEEDENEAAARKTERQDIEREKTRLTGELADLNRFIIKQENTGWALMSREEALAEKRRLAAELASITGPRNQEITNGIAETAGVLDYASHARFWLKHGTPDQKREVLTALGSNLTLKDKKLSITLHYPLTEIEKMIEVAPEIISTLEPSRGSTTVQVQPPFARNCSTVLRGLNAVRTYLGKQKSSLWRSKDAYFPRLINESGRWRITSSEPGHSGEN